MSERASFDEKESSEWAEEAPAEGDDEQEEEEVHHGIPKVVQLDGLVLLKIIKHCKENVPEVVTGQLLGLDIDGRLDVTNSFPFPSTDDNDENDEYQLEMMKNLRTVNVDNNTVGWYQSAFLGSFLHSSIVEAQYTYQKEIPSSVVVVYDPFRTTNGRLALKAYRLTESFLEVFSKKDFTTRSFAKYDLTAQDIFAEVPIKVHNSHLVHGFLYELREQKTMSCDFDRLDLNSTPFIEKNLGVLSDVIDEYSSEQAKFQFHQRQVARQKANQQNYLQKRSQENENRAAAGQDALPDDDRSKNPLFKPIAPPSRLESYLLWNQIAHYSEQITSASSQAFTKLYAVEALQQSARK